MLLILAVAAWVWGRWGTLVQSGRTRLVASLVCAFLVIAAGSLGLKGVDWFGVTSRAQASDTPWLAYDETQLKRLVSTGTPVLLDFTADWCLSCKVNEQVTLASASVQKRLRELGVTLMKADWTLRNEQVTRALARFGRSSVPLYVLYSGRGPEEFVLLPEVLTPGLMQEALNTLSR
jgi:thiol:disulfide interchange protein DsbD